MVHTSTHAPISYNIAFTPSADICGLDNVRIRASSDVCAAHGGLPIPVSSRLVLHSPKLTVVVGTIGSLLTVLSFFIGKSGRRRKATTPAALVNLDVFYVVHTTLVTRVTPRSGPRLVRAPACSVASPRPTSNAARAWAAVGRVCCSFQHTLRRHASRRDRDHDNTQGHDSRRCG